MDNVIPIIDLFAGPGGLGEGFSAFRSKQNPSPFRICLSVEKDPYACQTLRLRSFFRKFSRGNAPKEYYDHLKGQLSQQKLFELFPGEAAQAEKEALCAELGKISTVEIDKRINEALNASKTWLLIGGPPCQAYSTAGRSRMAKIWRENPELKESDVRHFLYKEYLRILAKHKPPLFLMENVRGLLSAKLSNGPIFKQILNDLKNPTSVFNNTGSKKVSYRLYSLVKRPSMKSLFGEPDFRPEDFLIKTEEFGIPQCRHRIIILGIRTDFDVEPDVLLKRKPKVSVGDVIRDLPSIRSCFSKGLDNFEDWKSNIHNLLQMDWNDENRIESSVLNEMKLKAAELNRDPGPGAEFIARKRQPGWIYTKKWFLDGRLRGYCNHVSKSHMQSDISRYFFAACYASVKNSTPMLGDFPKRLLPNHKNISAAINKGHFNDRFRVQVKNSPATTVTSHISKDGHYYIHPDPSQARSFTVREAARIQTFQDNYFFCGPRSQQYVQVGNAVPPLIARSMAEIIYSLIGAWS